MECLRNDGTQRSVPVKRGFADVGIRPMVAAPKTASAPYVTYALIAVNILVFALCVAQARGTNFLDSSIFVESALFRPWVADGEYWRLLTAGFLHFSLTHLAVNMISLFILGRDLEMSLGYPRFLGVYFTALFGGSAAVMLFGSDTSVTAGASGAIYGLMGAMLVVILKAKVSPTPVLMIIGVNLVMSITLPGISLTAHVGGLVFGAAATAAIIYAPMVLASGARTPRDVSIVGWVATVCLALFAIFLGVLGAGL